MTDKQKLRDITECGFYCQIGDKDRYYIYEIIKNTDKQWLQDVPEAKFLIDEWIYDYTDYDDRKIYGTSGNLTVTCFDETNIFVYKIKDIKYKIYGNCGQYLIEDKPTYKEQLKRKEQECEYLKNCLDKSFKTQADSELWWEKERKDLKTKLDQLKAENEELKEKFKKFFNIDNQECWDVAFLNNEKERYKQALDEIENVIEHPLVYLDEEIYNAIFDIINKAKDDE